MAFEKILEYRRAEKCQKTATGDQKVISHQIRVRSLLVILLLLSIIGLLAVINPMGASVFRKIAALAWAA